MHYVVSSKNTCRPIAVSDYVHHTRCMTMYSMQSYKISSCLTKWNQMLSYVPIYI